MAAAGADRRSSRKEGLGWAVSLGVGCGGDGRAVAVVARGVGGQASTAGDTVEVVVRVVRVVVTLCW